MAIDTENKRRSVHGYTFPALILPTADGTIRALDRQHVCGLYAGIAAGLAETIAFTLKITQQVAETLGISLRVEKTQKITQQKDFDLELL